MTRRTVQPLAREQSSSSSSSFLFSCISTTVALVLFGALVLAAVADADPMVDSASSLYGDNKHASDKRPFFVGSRYGRSHVYGAKDMRQVNVVPRNDRFFLGSRYGKRSDLTKEIESDNNNGIAELTYLACLHTGVSNLYRCYSRDSSSNALHQQETEQFDQQQQEQQQQHQRQFNDNADLSEK